ncbi:MAG TPA: choice-of-anchor Q domain-containing protein [Prolixibacteraceae bacterium]|nr:choice-of-anchor Q domain-containing protein [Prolixibacteraceae bacterium]
MRNLITQFKTILVLLLLAGCGKANTTNATSHYFINSLTGNDGNSGTSVNSSWKSLKKLEEINFQPDDTIYFECGSSWTGSFEISTSGTEDKPIVFTSYGTGVKPSISNTSATTLDGNAIRVSANYIVIDGFYIHDCAGTDPSRLAAIGNLDGKNHHITVKNCETKGCKVGVRMYAHDVLITNNYFHDPGGAINTGWGPMGIVGVSYNVEISYNRIENFLGANRYGFDGGAIEVDDNGPKYNWRIHHNYTEGNEGFLETIDAGECPTCTYSDFFIYYNFSDDFQWWVDGPIGTNPVLENNTVIRTRPKNSDYNLCLSLHTDVPNASIKNNIFVIANGITAFNRNAPSTYNIFYSADGSVQNPKGFALGQNEIVTDPQLVDIAKQNYHLKSTSPAIDEGIDCGYNLDLDGAVVPQGSSPDMGAYELKKLTTVTNIKAGHYYVNSQTGNDSNSGTSVNSPWKSLKNLEEANFQAGDSILFAKDSEFQGGFTLKNSGEPGKPIVLSNYGQGSNPTFTNPDYTNLHGNVIQVKGSYVIIDGLSFKNCANSPSIVDKEILLVGAVYAITGADYLTVKNCEFTDCPIGIYINSQHSLISNNNIHDCNRFLSEPDWGPIAIVIGNAFNEVSYNTCENYVKVSGNYGADGGFLKLEDRYFGNKVHDVKIHHNKSFKNMGFLEVESKVNGHDLDVYYNLSNDYQEFIFYWGGDNSQVENNTVIRTEPSLNGAVNIVFTMKNGNLILRNNIFIVASGIQVLVTAPYKVGNYENVIHENNLYYCADSSTLDPCGKPLGKGEIIANPLFVNPESGDYRLSPQSPAINAGTDLGYTIDLNNQAVPQNELPDMGAYESIK